MPKNPEEELKKLEYLGLDIENIPQLVNQIENLENITSKLSNEKQYRQYKFIPIKDIEILISSAKVSDTIQEKCKKVKPLAEYLDNKNVKYNKFTKMLENMKIEDVEKIEEEQSKLSKKIPFKVKFENDYLWPIYYIEEINKYFMIILESQADYSTFFYILKKLLSKKKNQKIFVPISNLGYSNDFFKKTQFKKIEDYLWTLTKDMPFIYEVTDKDEKANIQIVGEMECFANVKSWYKIILNNKKEADEFYEQLETIATIQKEFPNYFKFNTVINEYGEFEIRFQNQKMEINNLSIWINDNYILGIKKKNDVNKKIFNNLIILDEEKVKAISLDTEYLEKEKQITTFLQCKKSFFGKFKYFFKYGGKNKEKSKKNKKQEKIEKENNISKYQEIIINKNEKHNLKDFLKLYKECEMLENELTSLENEIRTVKLKNRNLKKKIENASIYIKEIDSHKKSIFEFWKYSNKDEVHTLQEGEEIQENVVKTVEKEFNYKVDLETLGKKQDRLQRKILSEEEIDSIYIASTEILKELNKLKNTEILPKDLETSLKQLKKQIDNEEIYEVQTGKMRKNKEKARNKVNILDISKTTKTLGYKLSLEKVLNNLKKAISKVYTTTDLSIYKSSTEGVIRSDEISIFNINPELEIESALKSNKNNISFYKINLKEKNNVIFLTNIIFYNNENRTLPVGMNLSCKVLIDLSKLDMQISRNSSFQIIQLEDEKDDFTKINLKTINMFEYDIK